MRFQALAKTKIIQPKEKDIVASRKEETKRGNRIANKVAA